MANPFETEPVLTSTIGASMAGLAAAVGLDLSGPEVASLTTAVAALLSGFARSKVTPEAHLRPPSEPPSVPSSVAGQTGGPL